MTTTSAETHPTLLDTTFALFTEPSATVTRLLSSERPPLVGTLLLTLAAVLFGPILIQFQIYGASVYKMSTVAGLALVCGCTVLSFIALESLLLSMLRIKAGVTRVAAMVSYSLSPLSLILGLFYLFNYLESGRLSLLTFLLTGSRDINDPFLKVMPWAVVITSLIIVTIFFYCLRSLGSMHWITATFMSLVSAALAVVSVKIGIGVGELVQPGIGETLWKVVDNPAAITYFF
jgi:hypothetical protein